MPRIHVTGGAGTGTTTLARALSGRLRIPHFDSDDYFWIPGVPPYRIKREPQERNRRIAEDLAGFDDWAWSGSALSWGHESDDRLTLCVFLTLPAELRLARLRAREERDHRDLPFVTPEENAAELRDFMAWAEQYEDGGLDVRSRQRHEQWLATLDCPVLRLDGDLSTVDRVGSVMDALA